MRRLVYNVAMSLDGFIADPDGGYDWIVMDDTIDFGALFARFDTLLMGRKTYEVVRSQGPGGPGADKETIVVSQTLRPEAHPGITLIQDRIAERVAGLKRAPGKDIWLFGGGELFRLLLDAGLVDAIEVAVMPVMLGTGIPVLPAGNGTGRLHLASSRTLDSGIVLLSYDTAKTS